MGSAGLTLIRSASILISLDWSKVVDSVSEHVRSMTDVLPFCAGTVGMTGVELDAAEAGGMVNGRE